MKTTTLIFILIIFSTSVFSQSEIWKLNGKKIFTDTLLVDTSDYVFYKSKKGRTKSIEKSEIFHVKQNSKTQIFYVPDSISDSFTVAEMQDYVQGMHDGRNHKSYIFVSGGAVVGLVTPLVFPLVGMGSGFTPIIPALYTLGIGIPKVREKKISLPKKHENNQHYIIGYQTTAKKKRIINTIITSVTGLASGIAISYLIYDFEL